MVRFRQARAKTSVNEDEIPLYNIEVPYGKTARFAFNIAGVVTNIYPRVRTGGDYGISADSTNISQSIAVFATKVTVWGVPADLSHDNERWVNGTATGAPSV